MSRVNRTYRPLRAAVVVAAMAAGAFGCADLRATRSLELYVERDFVTSLEQSRLALARDEDNKSALAMAGWASFQMGRHRAAQSYFRHILHLEPNNFDALLGMGWTQFKFGRVEVARQYFEQARDNVELPWQRRFVWDALGWVSLKKGDLVKARALFMNELKSIEYEPLMADANVGLGWIALTEKRFGEASEFFQAGARANPSCFNCFDGLARVDFEQGDYESALRNVLAGISKVRHSIHLVTLLAAVLEKIDDPRRSLQTYEQLIARYPEAAFFHVGMAEALLNLSRVADAERSLIQALALDPDYPGLKDKIERVKRAAAGETGGTPPGKGASPAPRPKTSTLGLLGAVQGPFASAVIPAPGPGYRNSAEHARPQPTLMEAVYRHAADHRTVRFEHAIVTDQQPAPLGPMLVSLSIYNKGWALLDAGRLDEAERAFQTAALTMPEELRYLMHDALGWVAFYRQDYARAAAIFMKILDERPDSYLSRKGLGFVRLAQGNFTEGSRLIEESLRQNPYQVPVSYVLPGEQLIGAGKFVEANRILEIGAWAHPRVAKITLLLASSLASTGRTEEAIERLEAAAAMNPVEVETSFDSMNLPIEKALPAIRALAWGLLLAGDFKGSRRRFDQLLSVAGNNPEAMRGRGFALFRLGEYKEAIVDLTAAARHEPDGLPAISQELPIPGTGKHAEVTYNAGSVLAWTYLKLGDAARAELEFRKTLKDHPSWLDALCGLGYTLLAQNDPHGAIRSFQAALDISPVYPDARSGMDAAKAALGSKNAAVSKQSSTVKVK